MNDAQTLLADPRSQGLSVSPARVVEYPRDRTLHELFMDRVRLDPAQPALVSRDRTLSYERLASVSARLARRMGARGVRPGDIVAIKMRRGMDYFVAMVAVLRAGGVYLPLSPTDRDKRAEYAVADAKPVLVLTDDPACSDLFGVPTMDVQSEADAPEAELPVGAAATDPAYVIYTSGSTGRPKGVLVAHRNVVRCVMRSGVADLSERTRLLQASTMTFDAAAFELWGMLVHGGTMVVVDQDVLLDGGRLAEAIREFEITTLFLTTPLFNHISLSDPSIFAALQQLIVGGDVISDERVAAVLQASPQLRVTNVYGPTENGILSTAHHVRPEDTHASIPIGRAIANTAAYVLDDAGAPVPLGQPGELCVGGDGVGLGYLGKPELTGRVFVDDPFVAGGRMYRTGDIALMRADGVIEFIGRKDGQVKIRGYRIELGEIEAVLRRQPLVGDAVVCALQRPGAAAGEKYLAGYVSAAGGLDEHELRNFLVDELPAHMIPSYLVVLDALPHNANGKVAREALPDPLEMLDRPAEYVPADGEAEHVLVELYQRMLGFKAIGTADSLFDLGADSLMMARLATAINERFGSQLVVADLFSNPTIAEIAARLGPLADLAPAAPAPASGAADRAAAYALSRHQYPIYLEQRKNERSVQYNISVIIELPGDLDEARFAAAWETVVARHEALRLLFELADRPVQRVLDRVERRLVLRRGEPVASELVQPFDLDDGPLWRASLHAEGGRRWFFLDVHHLVVDGSSFAQLVRELDALYRGEALPPAAHQYRDFVTWSEEGAGAALRQAHEPFWTACFAGWSNPCDLPTDFTRPDRRTIASSILEFDIERGRAAALRELAAAHGCTTFEVLGTVYALFLSAVTGGHDLTFGVPSSAKDVSGLDGTVGMFVNTLCMRVTLDPQDTVAAVLSRFAATARAAFEYQAFTLSDLTAVAGARQTPGRNALFDTMLGLQLQNMLRVTLLGTSTLLKPLYTGQTMFDLNLQIYEDDVALHAEWEYAVELFAPETMAQLRDTLVSMLDRVVAAPHAAVSELVPHLAGATSPALGSTPSAITFNL
ncbi:MAG: hypothetical protein QOI11_2749 [Candidatus Eremiobacteraeota bacterium]|jgi:amino acid adenylation domain-containing protein|nr:hypothetical protein [Candidatus Eremiobacteraeota bacterium]